MEGDARGSGEAESEIVQARGLRKLAGYLREKDGCGRADLPASLRRPLASLFPHGEREEYYERQWFAMRQPTLYLDTNIISAY